MRISLARRKRAVARVRMIALALAAVAVCGGFAARSAAAPEPTRTVILSALPFACEMVDEGAEAWVYCWEGQPNVKRHVKLEPTGEVSQTAMVPLPQGLGGPGEPYGAWLTIGRFRCEVMHQGIECVVIATGKGFLITRNRIVAVETAPGITEPTPVFGAIAAMRAVSGLVTIKEPGAKFAQILNEPARLPFGTLVDARRGAVQLATAATPEGGTQTGVFRGGQFRVTQDVQKTRAPDGSSVVGLTVLKLAGPAPQCGARASAVSARAKEAGPRHLWGNAHGNFQTGGRYASATVGGTKWLTEDGCRGTNVKVVRGVVAVEDLKTHQTTSVHAGHSLLVGSGIEPAKAKPRVGGVWMSGPGCGGLNEFRQHPAEFPFFCDGTAYVEKAHWSNWGKPRATASAILNEALLNAHNSVATAPRERTPVTVIVSRLKVCKGHRAYSSIVIKPDHPLGGHATLRIPTLCEFE
jgi:hypothetical protein